MYWFLLDYFINVKQSIQKANITLYSRKHTPSSLSRLLSSCQSTFYDPVHFNLWLGQTPLLPVCLYFMAFGIAFKLYRSAIVPKVHFISFIAIDFVQYASSFKSSFIFTSLKIQILQIQFYSSACSFMSSSLFRAIFLLLFTSGSTTKVIIAQRTGHFSHLTLRT